MSKAMEHIRYLVDVVGYRDSTSEAERWASKYIKSVMDKAGIESQVEDFSSPRTFGYAYMVILAVSILGGLLACSHGFIAFLITALAAVALYMENTCRGWIATILPRESSQNVVGRIPAQGEARRKVVLSAHYDTARSGLLFHPRFVGHFRTITMLTMLSVLALPILIVLGGMFWSGLFCLLRGLAVLWLAVSWCLLLHREVYGLNLYGANDNGSGTGVVLSLAETLAGKPLQDTEVWIAATGAEEAGLVGMTAFLKRHGTELQDALIINLDHVGLGQIKYITGEGMLKAVPSDPELLMLSAEVVRENPDLSPVPHEHRTCHSDAYAALVKGYRAMSIMAMDEDGVVPNWHWETDKIENLEEKNLEDVERFVSILLNKIDSER
jgi:hypothetical protein